MSNLKLALKIAKSGQPVFPCKEQAGEKTKAPYTRNGYRDATLDKEQIKRWWKSRPTAAVGIPTGVLWDVLDVDIKNEADGRVHLPYLLRLGLLDGCQRLVKTPSGGWHLYFKAYPGEITNKGRNDLGLDVRGTGGYVLAAGSWIDTGDYEGTYEEITPIEGSTDSVLPWGDIINSIAPVDTETRKGIVLPDFERQVSVASLRHWLSQRSRGERNNALHWAACRCIEAGINPNELTDAAELIGLSEGEIQTTIRSVMKRAGVTAGDLMSEAERMFG